RLQRSGSLRTWHFVKPLLDAGHEVHLFGVRIPGSYPDDTPPEVVTVDGRLHYRSVAHELFHDLGYLQDHLESVAPDALIGVNSYPSSRAAALNTDLPLWCDANGWVMAEAQTKAATYDDDRYLAHFWNIEKAIVDRADVISTVSRAQSLAALGELAARGRLNRRTVGYDFCRHVPNALAAVTYEHRFEVVRGKLVPEDAFVVLWVGGYNTWTDVELLYGALERAMGERDDLHYVSTGGALPGHDDLTFEKFQRRIEDSSFRDRVHFAGWVPTEQVPSYYFEADLGLNVDIASNETLFGARNRINDMLKVGLPVLTTLGTEISQDLADRRLALVAEIGDTETFAEHLLWAAEHRERLRAMGAKASAFAHDAYSYERTTRELLAWAADPQRAPDGGQRIDIDSGIDFFSQPLPDEDAADGAEAAGARAGEDHELDCEELERELALAQNQVSKLHSDLTEITSSKMFKLWMAYLKVRKTILG
ncbi:MAG: hypothetical protein AAGN46_14450, partial [Acidobacteriota bacterium]